MVRLLYINDPNPPIKLMGDIVYIADESDPPFSQNELDRFGVLEIPGIDDKTIIYDVLRGTCKPPTRNYDCWQDTDGKRYLLKAEPRCEFSMNNLTVQQRNILTSVVSTNAQKREVVEAMEWKAKFLPENKEMEIVEVDLTT